MSRSQVQSNSVYAWLLIFQTSIRLQVAIPQGTGGNPLASASFQRKLQSTDLLHWQSVRPGKTHKALDLSGGKLPYLCHVFPLLHPSKLQA